MNYKDILIRSAKTFVQAFVPVVAAAFATADLTEIDNLKAVAYSAIISGAAAGISAAWNIIIQIFNLKTPPSESADSYPEDDNEDEAKAEEIELDDEGFEPEDGFSC